MEKFIEALQQQIASQDRRYEEQQLRYEKQKQEQQRRHQKQIASQKRYYEEQQRRYEEQHNRYEEQLQILKNLIRGREQDGDYELPTAPTNAVATPNFPAFDSTSQLWSDYWPRFCTFENAHSVLNKQSAGVYLTNQTSTIYKMLSNLAAQQTPPKDINNLTMEQITNYMKKQF